MSGRGSKSRYLYAKLLLAFSIKIVECLYNDNIDNRNHLNHIRIKRQTMIQYDLDGSRDIGIVNE